MALGATAGTRKATADSKADRAETLRLYLEEKLTYAEITQIPGQPKTAGAVSKRISKALAERVHPMIDEWRSMEAARLEDERAAVAGLIARAGDDELKLKGYDRLIRYSDRLAKLLGADLPVKVEVSGVVESPMEAEHRAMIEEARREVAAREAALKGA